MMIYRLLLVMAGSGRITKCQLRVKKHDRRCFILRGGDGVIVGVAGVAKNFDGFFVQAKARSFCLSFVSKFLFYTTLIFFQVQLINSLVFFIQLKSILHELLFSTFFFSGFLYVFFFISCVLFIPFFLCCMYVRRSIKCIFST